MEDDLKKKMEDDIKKIKHIQTQLERRPKQMQDDLKKMKIQPQNKNGKQHQKKTKKN